MLAFPCSQLQAVSGEPWLKFLDQSLARKLDQGVHQDVDQYVDRDTKDFSRGCGRIFGAAVYQSSVDLEAEQIFSLCERWLNAIKPRLRQRSRAQ